MNGFVWEGEYNEKSHVSKKRKRRVGKRKIEFASWASRPLIEFLEAVGKDATTKHTQREVAALVIKYINENNLFSPAKKKKVMCDERLYALFAKKSLIRTKVYDMLEEHFTENHDDSDDEFMDSSDEENCREKKDSIGQMKKVLKTPKSCFAAIVPDNIKLIYLRKSLVQEFLGFPESFDCKIVGSFVRMRSDPHDIYQKNRFQLQLVTGIKKISEAAGAGVEVRLTVANYFKEIPISMLSDENFNEEEVEDARGRINAGVLKRLTVAELESKAQMLHTDITKHWIAKELILLKRRIDHANEKGWRKELFEYLDRRKLLQTPSEVQKLLLKIPEVIAEELEPDADMIATTSEKPEVSGGSPRSILRGTSDVSSTDASGSGGLATPSQTVTDYLHTPQGPNGDMDNCVILAQKPYGPEDTNKESLADWFKLPTRTSKQVEEIGHEDAKNTCMADWFKSPSQNSKKVEEIEDQPVNLIQQEAQFTDEMNSQSSKELQAMGTVEKSIQQVMGSGEKSQEKPKQLVVIIDLSDDEPEKTNDQITGECPYSAAWYYLDPQGITQGPFSLSKLKEWRDANYFDSGFTVWKGGQSPNDPVLLADVLGRIIFPC